MLKNTMLSLLVLICIASATMGQAYANPMVAVAADVETPDNSLPGLGLLNKGINELIRLKVNLLLMGGVVQSGSDVLTGLKKYGIDRVSAADSAGLAAYGSDANVDYLLLVSLKLPDISLNLKLFDVKNSRYLADKTINDPDAASLKEPDGALTSAGYFQAVLDKVKPLLDTGLDEILQLIPKS